MSLATTTVAGEIQLAGDLAGNNNGASPALTNTGVTAGSYNLLNATIDSKGRVTAASSATANQVTALLPTATSTVAGIASVDTSTPLTITAGAIGVATATNASKGVVQLGTTLKATAGVVDIDTAGLATSSTLGVVSVPAGSGLSVTGGQIGLVPATPSTIGGVKVGTGLSVAGDGTVSAPYATDSVAGVVKISALSNLTVSGDGTLSLNMPPATNSTPGVVYSANSQDIAIDNGTMTLGINVAKTNVSNQFTATQYYATYTVTTGGLGIQPDFGAANIFEYTITADSTFSPPSNYSSGTGSGSVWTIVIKLSGTTTRTITLAGGYNAPYTTFTLTQAQPIAILTVVSTASTLYTSIARGFE